MLDDTIPLTTGEYDEWGNPNDEEYYHYMKSYSPYDNVEAKDYPIFCNYRIARQSSAILGTSKMGGKIKRFENKSKPLVFKTDMTSGHGGASGRFESLKEDALEYAFLLKLEK